VHLTGSCPKNAIISIFSGHISIPHFFAVFYNVNIPLCKPSPESADITSPSAKSRVFIFKLFAKAIPFM
jgi:hypothetical protein